MKKQNQDKKKLSLKKLQLIKVTSMKKIKGGNGDQGFGMDDYQDPQTPPTNGTVSFKTNK